MLMHRTDGGYVRWMDVNADLKSHCQGRKTPIRQILFKGERFTALNLKATSRQACLTLIPGILLRRLFEQEETKVTKVVLLFVTFVTFCSCFWFVQQQGWAQAGPWR